MEKTEISWNAAQEKVSKNKSEALSQKEEYQVNLLSAEEELWERLGNSDFRTSDFSDICNDYGVEEDDLLFNMI